MLHVRRYSNIDRVLESHHIVPEGFSSSIFTDDLREAETYPSARGGDCGIANVNIGPSMRRSRHTWRR